MSGHEVPSFLQNVLAGEAVVGVVGDDLDGSLGAVEFAEQALDTVLRIGYDGSAGLFIPLDHINEAGLKAELAADAQLLVNDDFVHAQLPPDV